MQTRFPPVREFRDLVAMAPDFELGHIRLGMALSRLGIGKRRKLNIARPWRWIRLIPFRIAISDMFLRSNKKKMQPWLNSYAQRSWMITPCMRMQALDAFTSAANITSMLLPNFDVPTY